MIGKKIKNTTQSTKAARIGNLTEYIREPEKDGGTEKCVYHGSRNFIFDTPEAQTAEMIALAQESKSKDPIEHHIFSWQEGEQPTREQIDSAVSIILKEYGLEMHQVVYGLHSDTDNWHLHICINRVSPETMKCVDINQRFTHEAIHKAVARIEKEQGWNREPNGRYIVLENDEIARTTESRDTKQKPSQKKIDKEVATGEKSLVRIIQEKTIPILDKIKKKQITTWNQFHSELATNGIAYEKFGGGAVFRLGETTVKASEVNRDFSLSKMEWKKIKGQEPDKILGTYEAPEAIPSPIPNQEPPKPEPIAEMPVEQKERWKEYTSARTKHNEAKANAKAELSKRQDKEWSTLLAEQKDYRETLLWGNWQGKGKELNERRKEIAEREKKEQAEMKARHRLEKADLQKRFPDWPRYEDWLADPTAASQYRHREALVITPTIDGSPKPGEPKERSLPNFRAERIRDEIHYTRTDGGGGGGVSFIDRGPQITVLDWKNPDILFAAMKLSQEKWPEGYTVTGSDQFKTTCAKLAALHDITINNPELQETVKAEKARIADQRSRPKPNPLTEFERYAEAVNADRFRVTVIKFNSDLKNKKTFVLDKGHDGVSRGFTPQEITDHTPEMLRLQSRDENIYYTPLSETKHHILIDDLSRDKLDKLIADGYKPAVIIESSTNNFQAIITIPKLGIYDVDVANQVSKRLNTEYGDKKLSGAIHPHRAPGYENRKPSHRQLDNTFPEVKLRKAERRECPKTLALAHKISKEYEEQSRKPTSRAGHKASSFETQSHQAISSNHAYTVHYNAIKKILKNDLTDPSRLDSMIAVRLRATGHSQSEIEKVILENAPAIEQRNVTEKRNWLDYAQRTAKYAFTPAADKELVKYAKYKQQWITLEQPPKPTPTKQPELPKTHKKKDDWLPS